MEDLAYLVRESSAAWLGGHGDGRFKAYENFYRHELDTRKRHFDLEKVNEDFERVATDASNMPPAARTGAVVGKAAIGIFVIYLVSLVLKQTSQISPAASGAVVIAILFGLRKMRRKQQKELKQQKQKK